MLSSLNFDVRNMGILYPVLGNEPSHFHTPVDEHKNDTHSLNFKGEFNSDHSLS